MPRTRLCLALALCALLAACGQSAASPPTAAPAAPTAAPTASDVEARIASAESAGIAAIIANATIVDYPAVATDPLVELRKGSNGWTCFADWPATPKPDPQCFDKVWMDWYTAFAAGKEPSNATIGIGYMLAGGQDASATDPFATEPPPGADWVDSPPHIMVLMPEKLDPALYSTDHHSGGPYIMWAGTPYEHIMMPIEREAIAQTDDRTASAESAAPTLIAGGATLVDYPADPAAPLVELRKGENGWTCFADWPATPGNDPQCFDKPWMEWFAAFSAGETPKLSGTGLSYMLQGGQDASETDPLATEPPPGEDWVNSPPHIMIVTAAKLDPARFGAGHHSGGPYVMWAGTPYEHIMVPVR